MYIDCVSMMCFVAVGKSREAEEKRINKELANIRSKFKGQLCAVVNTLLQCRTETNSCNHDRKCLILMKSVLFSLFMQYASICYSCAH